MKKLDELRKEINDIDESLLSLYRKRLAAVRRIAEIKKENGIPVTDAERDKIVLARAAAGEESERCEELYRFILSQSKELQNGERK